ncbi:MAG: hypothetical protein H7239_15935 [Flavobacterium sp.]|nr:hypothetical protein [Flavobacterium sp.]
MATGTKTGGRSKGTPNRTTAETKQLLQTIVGKELDNLGTMLEQLEPNERINAISKLLPYILPKQSEVKTDLTANVDLNQKPPFDLSKLSDAALEELQNLIPKIH